MLESIELPADVKQVRATPEFSAETVPDGLLSAHRVAQDVWGLLCVREGTVTFVVEDTGDSRALAAGDTQVIEPGVTHHVEPGTRARFVVEFYR